MALTEKQMTIISAVGGVVLTGAIGFLSYMEWSKIEEIKDKAKAQDTLLKRYNDKYKKIPEVTKEIKELAETFAVYRRLLPTGEKEVNLFYKKMGEWREQLKIGAWKIDVTKPDWPDLWKQEREGKSSERRAAQKPAAPRAGPPPKGYEEYPRYFTFEASFWQLGKLLNQIERWDRFAMVTDLTLAHKDPAKKEYGNITLKVGFGLRTYFFTGEEINPVGEDGKTPLIPDLGAGKEPTSEQRERVLGKPFVWTREGTDNWAQGLAAGGRLGDKFLRNPFDPFPTLTEDTTTEEEAIQSLEKELASLEEMVRKKDPKEKLLEKIAELQKVPEPGTPAGQQRWKKARERLAEIQDELQKGPVDPKIAIELAKVKQLEAELDRVKELVKQKNIPAASRNLNALEVEVKGAELTTARAKEKLDGIRKEIATLREKMADSDETEAYAKAERMVKEMKEAFGREEYPKVSSLGPEVAKLAAKFAANQDFQKLLAEARVWEKRAALRQEIAGFQLTITGVVNGVSEGRVVKFVFVNGIRYELGGGGGIELKGKKISIVGIETPANERSMSVTFEYEGEKFTRTKKAGGASPAPPGGGN